MSSEYETYVLGTANLRYRV